MSDNDNSKLSSTLGTFVTLLGYSWGMSDIWRFPFLAYRNGGGAFLIPFLITIVLCGIPMYYLEFCIGKFSGKGPYKVWDVAPLFRGVGITIITAYTTYLFGTTAFRGWMFQFPLYSFQNPLPWTTCNNSWNQPTCRESVLRHLNSVSQTDKDMIDSANKTLVLMENSSYTGANATLYNVSNLPGRISGLTSEEEFWQYEVLELSSGLTDLYPFQWKYVLFTFIWRVLVTCICIFGIRAIEKAISTSTFGLGGYGLNTHNLSDPVPKICKVMYVTTIVPVLTSIAVLIRSLMLPGSTDGIYHFFYPDMTKLAHINIWIEAFVMAFYTLAFGWGCIMMLGSHTRFKDHIGGRAAVLCPILTALMATFQGMVCFSVLGNMAAVNGVHMKDVIEANWSTGIIALVSAVSVLPFPQIWSILLFTSIVLSSLDSQLVPFGMIVDVLGELYPIYYAKYRIHMICGLSMLIFLLGLPFCTGAGTYLFLMVDWYSGAWSGPIVALVEVIVIGWVYGMDKWNEDVKMMTGKPLPLFLHIGIAFFTPLFLLIILLASIIEYIPPSYGTYVYPGWARLLGWLTVVAIISPILIIAVRSIYMRKGPLMQRFKQSLKPTEHWGPADNDSVEGYDKVILKYKSRPYKDLLMYNISRRVSVQNVPSQELKGLV